MPVYEIGLDDGRKLHIEADNQEAALAGVQHFQGGGQHQGALSGLGTAAKAGLSNLVSGVGETGKRYLGVGQGAIDAGKSIAPTDAPGDTTLYDDKGLHLDNLPRYLAESSPSVAAAMTAAKLTPGPLWAKLGAAGVVGLGSMAGNYAKQATAARTGNADDPSNTEDLVKGAVRAAPEAALQSLPLGRFIGAPAAGLGLKGVAGALGRGAVDAASMGAGNAASNTYDQLNQTGTVDPNQVINSGIGGAAVGGALGAGRVAGDVNAAVKYRGLADADPAHVAEAANRMQDANTAAGGNLNSVKGGYNAFRGAQSDVGTELKSTYAAIGKNNLSQASQNALARSKQGLPLTDADFASLNADTGSAPEVADLQRLAGVSDVLKKVGDTGNVDDASGKFKGGLSGAMDSHMRAFTNPTSVALGSALGLGHLGDIVAYSPHALAALGGSYGAARAMDALTGARSAGGSFANRFADPGIETPQIGSGQGQAILDRMASPTGPKIAQPPRSPWGDEPSPTQPEQAPDLGFSKMAQTALRKQMMSTTKDLQQPQAPAPQEAPPQLPLSPIAMQMLKKQMANPPQAPQEPAPQAPQLPQLNPIAMKMLKQNMSNPPQAPQEPAPQAPQLPQFNPIAMKMLKQQMANPPAAAPASDVQAQAPAVPPAPALPPAMAPIIAKVQKANGKTTITPKAPEAPAPKVETPLAPTPAPTAAPATAAKAPVDLSQLEDGIPAFLRRDQAAAKAPAAPPQQAVAKQALEKLNGNTPPKLDLTPTKPHTAEELAMSPKEFSDNVMSKMDLAKSRLLDEKGNVKTAQHDAMRSSIERKVTWKASAANKLAELFPHEGSKDAFYHKLLGTHGAAPVRSMRDALAAKHPAKAAAVNSLLDNKTLGTIWKTVSEKK